MSDPFSAQIRSQSALASTGAAVEQDSAHRYSELAALMRDRGESEAAALFQRISNEAARHRVELDRRGSQGASAERAPVGAPEFLGASVHELDLDIATTYEVVAAAVRDEGYIFRFFSHVAANAPDETVRRQAERLAKETLARAALLRIERRRAYHKRSRDSERMALPEPALVESMADLLFVACSIERDLANSFAAAAQGLASLKPLAEETHQDAEALRAESAAAGEPQHVLASYRRHLPPREGDETRSGAFRTLPKQALINSKRAFAFYDAVVSAATDEAVMLKAQALSARVLSRMSVVAEEA